MDISSLLSPQDSPRDTPSPSRATPKKPRRPRAKSNVQAKASPTPRPSIPSAALAHIIPSPPTVHPASALRVNATHTPPVDGSRSARQGSTPGMDTLADLASMQHHQQATRASAGGLRSTEIYDSQIPANPTVPNFFGIPGSLPSRASMDLAMADAATETPPPRTYSAGSLSEPELQMVSSLVGDLAANPFAHESHVQLVNILHRGLRAHVRPSSPSAPKGDPRTYDLLSDLQSAREAMDARFALGEELWIDYIEDQKLLASTFEECIAVMELCLKAVHEESASTKLWSLYANWILSMYWAATNDPKVQDVIGEPDQIQSWTEEDKMVAREVCNWQQMMDVWGRGSQATMWRVDESHVIWNPYTELLLQDLAENPTADGILSMKTHFFERLQVPHASWDDTFQMFSTFISRFDNRGYEDIMMSVNRECASTKAAYAAREMLEIGLRRSGESGDSITHLSAFNEYIEWEMAQSRKKRAFVFELVDILYQRATFDFPANTGLWESYMVFLNDEIITQTREDIPLVQIYDRATKHCPWSGTLWSQYLLAAERQKMPFTDIDNIKHKATSTGLLDAGGLEEILQVYVAWCSVLRRRAFQEESTDEELDVAEVGIRSAIEDMQRLGEGKYGQAYQGDPNYRLERIYIKYLTQSRNWHAAREYWKTLIPSRGDNHEFWIRYYIWEMTAWAKITYGENTSSVPNSPRPSEATKVLRMGLKRPKLDWPEKLLEIFQYHCEDHEDAEELQSASVLIWKIKKALTKRREREAIEAYQVAQEQTMQQAHTLKPEVSADSVESFTPSKRKREDEGEDLQDQGALKKTRGSKDDGDPEMERVPATTAPLQPKRDRENASVIIKNLPARTTETQIKQFFRDCGTIRSLVLADEVDGGTAIATVEFESSEDALTARTKDLKEFNGRIVEVQVESGTTIYSTNFPPTADEDWIRRKFEKFGDILDVRFPSLKYNTHRRFCYIQFKTADQATAATQIDGESVGPNLNLTAKISAPNRRQGRSGALQEGREIHIVNLDWAVTEPELEELFSKYGQVERARIPTALSGKSKGFAFVTFSKKEDATAALDMNNTIFKSRVMTVDLATKNPAKRQAATVVTSQSRSASPTSDKPITNGDHPNAASPVNSNAIDVQPRSSDISARTIALLNVPDTVNDARIRAVAEPYGPLVKVILRPDHQGAIIEFREVSDAGKAAMGIDGHEIIPGRHLGVGTVGEMKRQKEEKKHGGSKREPNKHTEVPKSIPSSVPIRRPAQPRHGGRGGLGVKRGGPSLKETRHITDGADKAREDGAGPESNRDGPSDGQEGGPKSNADFKAMFLGR